MSQQNELQIKFRIQRIETLQFALLQEDIAEDKLAYSVNFGYAIDTDALVVRSKFRYELLRETQPCLLIEVAVDFAIEQKCFEEHFKKEGKPVIPQNFATHMAMITVGTTRGILHEKTKDSPLNSLPIPTVNVSSKITEDISFEDE